MSLHDRLTQWLERRQQAREAAPAPDIMLNRAARRRAGIRTPVGLITEQHIGLTVPEETTLPRYARRHFPSLTGPRTRRNRRHTARIMRSLAAAGRLP